MSIHLFLTLEILGFILFFICLMGCNFKNTNKLIISKLWRIFFKLCLFTCAVAGFFLSNFYPLAASEVEAKWLGFSYICIFLSLSALYKRFEGMGIEKR